MIINKMIERVYKDADKNWPQDKYPAKGKFMKYAPTFVIIVAFGSLVLMAILGVVTAIVENVGDGIFISVLSLSALIVIYMFIRQCEKNIQKWEKKE